VVVLALCYPLPVEAKSFNAQFPEELLSARLKKIGELSDATILFDPLLVASTRVLSLNAENITVEQVLDRTLSGTAFTWKKTAETSYAVLKKGTLPAQTPALRRRYPPRAYRGVRNFGAPARRCYPFIHQTIRGERLQWLLYYTQSAGRESIHGSFIRGI